MEQLSKKNEWTNFLNDIFSHYAFPIKTLKRIQIEPIENQKNVSKLNQSE